MEQEECTAGDILLIWSKAFEEDVLWAWNKDPWGTFPW